MVRDGICARCGEAAKGYAFIDNERYCHPDCASEGPDCYSLAQGPRISNELWWINALADGRKGST